MTGIIDGPTAIQRSIVTRLESEMLRADVAAGTRLDSERVLAWRFGVSRPVIREVLRSLQSRGLIEVHPGRGSFVRDHNPADAATPLDSFYRRSGASCRQLVVARSMLESEAAELAAARRDPDDCAHLKRVLDAIDSASDVSTRSELDLMFHEGIAHASGNPVIELMFGSIRHLVLALILRSTLDRALTAETPAKHGAILAAILDGDPAAARRHAAEHLTIAYRFYGADIDRPIDEVLDARSRSRTDVGELDHRLNRNRTDAVPLPTTNLND